MTERLARLANRAARRRAAGVPYEWLPSTLCAPAYSPWAGVPDCERIASVEVLPDGTVVTVWLDTEEDLARRRRAVEAPAPADPDELPPVYVPAPLRSEPLPKWQPGLG